MEKNRIEEILVSNSSLVSGLSEASGVNSSWVEVSQKVREVRNIVENLDIEGLVRDFNGCFLLTVVEFQSVWGARNGGVLAAVEANADFANRPSV